VSIVTGKLTVEASRVGRPVSWLAPPAAHPALRRGRVHCTAGVSGRVSEPCLEGRIAQSTIGDDRYDIRFTGKVKKTHPE
jgi:hypothetical protein